MRAYLRALETVAAGLADQVARLTARVAELEARLGQTSANTSKPPSSDGPTSSPHRPRPRPARPRADNPGTPGTTAPACPRRDRRTPTGRRSTHCRHELAGDDPEPLAHQVVERPPVRPPATEYRRHRLACPRCGRVACGQLPADASSGYGPRVQATAALLSGAYRVGERGVARLMGDPFGVPIRPATACGLQHHTAAALAPVAAEAQADVAGRPVDVDETSRRQARKRAWLWVAEWKRVRDGTLARSAFQSDTLLAAGAAVLRGIEAGLSAFAATAGVEPTNTAAERAVRRAVCWRKTSGGTDGASGSRFVERVLTVVASCRRQNRDVLAVPTAAVRSARTGATPPSLVPAGARTLTFALCTLHSERYTPE